MGAAVFFLLCLWMISDIANNIDKKYHNNKKPNKRR